MKTFDTVQLQSGKLVDWESLNPTLLEGELAIVFDSETLAPIGIKAGNGTIAFNDLPFMGAGSFTTYTKEEIDRKLSEVTGDILVVKTNVNNILSYLPDNVSQTNKLVTKSDISNIESKLFIPTDSQLQTINSGITSDTINKLLNKVVTETINDQAYIKTSAGEQSMLDIVEGSSIVDTGLALKKSGKLKTGNATESDDAVNKSQLDNIKEILDTTKLDKSNLQDSNEYVYSHLNTSDPLLRVDTGTRADSIVKRSQAGTIRATRALINTDVVILQQLDEVKFGLSSHTSNFNNPHNVTKAQLGLENVNNTSDRDKPISSQTQLALDTKQPKIPGSLDASKYLMQPPLTDGDNPTLFNLDLLATSKNLEKEISDRKDADNLKVDKRTGYGLSQNDLTNDLKRIYDSAALKISQLSAISGLTLNGEVVPVNQNNVAELSNIARSTELNAEITNRQQQDKILNDLITDESNARKNADAQLNSSIETISKVIPNSTGEINQLTNKSQVLEMISSLAGFYITSDITGDAFATKAVLDTATIFYSGGEERIPQKNDYCLVLQDESHNNSSTRYVYQKANDASEGIWQFQYIINNSPLTEDQQKALNSGITSDKVNKIETNTDNIESLETNLEELEKVVDNNTASISTNAADIKNIKSTLESLDRDTVISKFYENYEWATSGEDKLYLKKLNGQQYVGDYASYIDGLRGLPFLSYVPYDKVGDLTQLAVLVKYGDETQPLYFISEDAGVVLKIDTKTDLLESISKIIYDERSLFEVVTENILKDKLEDYLKFDESVSPTDNDTILVYTKNGVAVNSGKTINSFNQKFNNTQIKSFLKLSNNLTLTDNLNSIGNLNIESFSGVQFDAEETILDNSFANLLLSENYILGTRANSTLPIRLLGTNDIKDNTGNTEVTLDNVSTSIVFLPGGISITGEESISYNDVNVLNIVNSSIKFIDKGKGKEITPSLILNIENSDISLDMPDRKDGELTFKVLKNSRVDLNTSLPDTETLEPAIKFVDVSASTVYLHGKTKIAVAPSSKSEVHAEELEVILCEDYELSLSEAISGTNFVSRITDLRTIIYSSGVYKKILTSDDWSKPEGKNEFEAKITFSEHRCGYLETEFYVPRVKTYAQVSGTVYEEVYDSATIDTLDGTVTIYSNFNDINYLVVIS